MRNKELSLRLRSFGVLLLVAGTLAFLLISAGDAKEGISKLQFTAHPDGTFSVVSSAVPLETLLSKITEATKIAVYVNDVSKKRPVTIDVKNNTLVQLLKRIAGDNYAIVYDKHTVTALHVLPQGKYKSSEFSGKVQISGKRAKMFFMPPDDSKESINTYIKRRHVVLKELSEKDPDKKLQAQISFQGYMVSDQAVALVKENTLEPVTLNIGWKENGGGHDLVQGESIEDALELAALDQEEFLSVLQEDADRQITSQRQKGINDKQMGAELEFKKNADDLRDVFNKKGITLYGIQVAASAKQLHKLTSNDKTIRLVDPLWGGSVEEEITKVYITTKVAIPLTPEKETFAP